MFVQLPPFEERNLGVSIRESLRWRALHRPVIVSVADLAATLAGHKPTSKALDSVHFWIKSLLAAGTPPSRIIVYRQSQLPALALNALLLGRAMNFAPILQARGPVSATAAARAVTVADIFAAAVLKPTLTFVEDPAEVETVVEHVRHRYAIQIHHGHVLGDLWTLPGLPGQDQPRDADALRAAFPIAADAPADDIYRCVRRLSGNLLSTLHGLLRPTCRCVADSPHAATRQCIVRAVDTGRRSTVAQYRSAESAIVAVIARRSHRWAVQATNTLLMKLHDDAFDKSAATPRRSG
jgi:hypothetical protein